MEELLARAPAPGGRRTERLRLQSPVTARRVLVSAAGTLDVLAAVAGVVDAGAVLSADERDRHDRLVFTADRRAFVAARVLARLLHATYDGGR